MFLYNILIIVSIDIPMRGVYCQCSINNGAYILHAFVHPAKNKK